MKNYNNNTRDDNLKNYLNSTSNNTNNLLSKQFLLKLDHKYGGNNFNGEALNFNPGVLNNSNNNTINKNFYKSGQIIDNPNNFYVQNDVKI